MRLKKINITFYILAVIFFLNKIDNASALIPINLNEERDGSVLYTYQSSCESTVGKKEYGIILPAGNRQIDTIYLYFHGYQASTPQTMCESGGGITGHGLCANAANLKTQGVNPAIIVPQGKDNIKTDDLSLNATKMNCVVDEAKQELQQLITNGVLTTVNDTNWIIAGHSDGWAPVKNFLVNHSANKTLLFDACYSTGCEDIVNSGKAGNIFIYAGDDRQPNYGTLEQAKIVYNNHKSSGIRLVQALKPNFDHYSIRSRCFLDHKNGDLCGGLATLYIGLAAPPSASFCRCAYSLKAGDNKIECYSNTEGCDSWKSDLYADPSVNTARNIFCAEVDDCGRWPLVDRKKNIAASTVGCCQIYQGGPLNKCWNTLPENCLKGTLEERRLFQTQTCDAISDCNGKIASPNESICDQNGCRVCDPNKGCRPDRLSNLLIDLNVRKPILEINIPGLKFSNVVSSTDETGTYFYIAWIPQLISALYKFGLAIVSIVAVVMIIIQGITIASGGFISKTIKEGGKDVVISAYKNIGRIIVGLMIAWGSFAILYNINPALVQFNALKVKVVERQELPAIYEEPPITDVSAAIVGNVPYFAQGDKRWGKKKPGDPDWPNSVGQGQTCNTIVARACGTTALAMVLKFYGKNVDPLVTAAYGLGCEGPWQRSATLKNWSSSPWSDLKIKSLGTNEGLNIAMTGKPIIFGCKPCVGLTGEGKIMSYPAHYMVLTGSQDGGKTFTINDPGNSPPRGIVSMTRDQILRPTLSEYEQGKKGWRPKTVKEYEHYFDGKVQTDGTFPGTPNSMTYIYP